MTHSPELLPFWIFLLILPPPAYAAKRSNELTVDISEDCQNNSTTSIHLSYGAGAADARIILLRAVNSFAGCSVLVVSPDARSNCKDKCASVVVVELFIYQLFNTSCNVDGSGIYLKSKGKPFQNVCGDILNDNSMKDKHKHYMKAYLIEKKRFYIDINFGNLSGTIRMTLTGARYLGNYGNCTEKELYCILQGEAFCVDKYLECDGNWNCGTPNMYDEYCENLYIQEPFMVIYGIILVAVLMFFFVQILRVCVPTVADHFFIFNEDQDYNFVLTSQSLPPLRSVKLPDDKETERQQRRTRATENQIY